VSAATVRPPILEAASLTRHFALQTGAALGRRTLLRAVQEVDLALRPGAVTALVGESGSGKSTVARLLALLDRPTAGAIRYGDVDAARLRGRRKVLRYRSQVQLIFQDPFASLNPAKRVEHHLARPLRIHRIVPRKLVHMRVVELLESVGLFPGEEFAGKYPHELSGGQRQRVAIARALAVEPKILLADEPISMLDVSIRAGILNLMLELKEQREIAFLYITHDLASARYVADEVLVMLSGRIVERGPTDAVLHEPLHPYTQLLLSAVPDPEARRERPALRRPDLAALDADAPLVEARPGHWVRMEVAQ
jgi:peptide/nickel transport system ATP-binding protein